MKKIMVYFMNIIGKGLTEQKELLAVLVIFVLADYMTEIMVDVIRKKITQGIGIEGILKRGGNIYYNTSCWIVRCLRYSERKHNYCWHHFLLSIL